MARFTLVLLPNGKALMVTNERLLPEHMAMLRTAWESWREGHQDILFIAEAEVRLVENIELRIEESNMSDVKGSPQDTTKSPMQKTAEQAQKDTEKNQREQMSPNTRDNAAKIGQNKGK